MWVVGQGGPQAYRILEFVVGCFQTECCSSHKELSADTCCHEYK